MMEWGPSERSTSHKVSGCMCVCLQVCMRLHAHFSTGGWRHPHIPVKVIHSFLCGCEVLALKALPTSTRVGVHFSLVHDSYCILSLAPSLHWITSNSFSLGTACSQQCFSRPLSGHDHSTTWKTTWRRVEKQCQGECHLPSAIRPFGC